MNDMRLWGFIIWVILNVIFYFTMSFGFFLFCSAIVALISWIIIAVFSTGDIL